MKRAPSTEPSNKPLTAVSTKRTVREVDLVANALSITPRALDLYRNLRSLDAPITTTPTAASRRSRRDVGSELKTRILDVHASTPLRNIGLIWTPCRDCDSPAGALRLDMPKALKHSPRLKRQWGHSISRVVTATGPANSDAHSFGVTACVVTLVFSPDVVGTRRFIHRNGVPVSSNTHLRPLPEPQWLDDPTPDHIEALIEIFMTASINLRRAFDESWREHDRRLWRSTREQRALALFQIDAQIPIAKTFFGAGLGEVILRQALAKPNFEARLAKKAQNSLDRADVVHLFCLHALATNGAPPPLVKL